MGGAIVTDELTQLSPEAIIELELAAAKAKAEAEATKAYVLEHFRELIGKTMPLEILGVQNLPSHSCLIVNDTLLLSYVEAEQLLNPPKEDDVIGFITNACKRNGVPAPLIGENTFVAFNKICNLIKHLEAKT